VYNEEQRGNVINKEDLATSFQDVVVEIISKKTIKALKDYNVKNLILAGGVAANNGLRNKLSTLCVENDIRCSFPPIKYCTDNAAMIATAGYFLYKRGEFANLDLNARSNIELQ